MSLHVIRLTPSEIVNPLLPPLPVLIGLAGGVALLVVVGAVLVAILSTRKR